MALTRIREKKTRKTQDPPSNPEGGAPRVSILWQNLWKCYALSVPAVNKFKRLRPGHPPMALADVFAHASRLLGLGRRIRQEPIEDRCRLIKSAYWSFLYRLQVFTGLILYTPSFTFRCAQPLELTARILPSAGFSTGIIPCTTRSQP